LGCFATEFFLILYHKYFALCLKDFDLSLENNNLYGVIAMFDIGIVPENFNPRVLYTFRRKYEYFEKIHAHSHDFTTMVFVLSGTCRYKINEITYSVGEGDIVICNPWAFHNKVVAENEEVTEFHCAFTDISVKNLPKDFILGVSESPIIKQNEYSKDLMQCCNDIILAQEKHEPDYELVIKAAVMRLIAIFLKATSGWQSTDIDDTEDISDFANSGLETHDKTNIVNNIALYIDKNFMKDLSLNKISKNMYLSPTYLSKIFKEEKGDSPINYLIKTRLSKARDLLETGEFSVKAAAKSVGYDDAYYFSKLFKKYYGNSPSYIAKSR